MKAPEIQDWARLAAFIDGEGCIAIHKQATFRGKISGHRGYVLRVRVVNNDPRLMQWLKSVFGGRICEGHSKSIKHVLFTWDASAKEAEFVLNGCMPFLILKREQAEIGLAFRKTFQKKNYEPVSRETMQYREFCQTEISKFNSGDAKVRVINKNAA